MLTKITRGRAKVAYAAIAVAAACTLAACGSSGSAQSSASSAPSSSGSSNSAVAAAQAFLAPYTKPPTSLTLTTPLTSKPAAGKTFVWMQCDEPQCAEITGFLRQATQAVGWNLKTVDYQTANPATLVAGLMSALQYKPTAVSLVGLPEAVWGSVLPAYKAAHVALIPQNAGDPPLTATVPAAIGGTATNTLWAQLIANWFIQDSGGSGQALLVSTPELAPTPSYLKAFNQAIQSGCPNCKITPLSEGFADVAAGKLPGAIVSELQQHPKIKYVINVEQALAGGVSQAVSAAGLTNIKYAGSAGESTEESEVQAGSLSAETPDSLNLSTWMVFDAALRFSEGQSQPAPVAVPTMLITKSSGITPNNSFDYPADWQAEFKKLWLVG